METVWYASAATVNNLGCPVSAGSSGVLNTELRGAPVISIQTGTKSSLTSFLISVFSNFFSQ